MSCFLFLAGNNLFHPRLSFTAQKLKIFIKDFFSKFDQIRRKLRIWSHLLKKSLMENIIFCAVILSISPICLILLGHVICWDRRNADNFRTEIYPIWKESSLYSWSLFQRVYSISFLKIPCTKNEEILNGKLNFLCKDTQFDSLCFLVTGV